MSLLFSCCSSARVQVAAVASAVGAREYGWAGPLPFSLTARQAADVGLHGPISRGGTLRGSARWLGDMFFLFSNRLGCLGSLLLSAVVTIALLFLLGVVRF
jgi:hypothetical protein